MVAVVVSEDVRMTFGDQLRGLRRKAGLSQPEFAAAVELTASAVRDYEQGRRIPSWPAIVRISRALGVAVDAFSGCDEVAGVAAPGLPKTRRGKK